MLEHCLELATIDPSDPEPWRLMAWVHEDGGYDERVIEALKKVVELDPNDSGKERLNLTDTLIRIGHLSEAQRQFGALRAKSPDVMSQHPLIETKLSILEGKDGRSLTDCRGRS